MEFDAKKVKNEIVKWIQDFFYKNGKDCNAVVGISGGKDSSVVAALCVEALGKDRVIGVLMPQGNQPDIDYSKMLCDHLGIDRMLSKKYTASKVGTQKVFNATSKSLSFARGVSVDSLNSAQSVCFMSSVLDEVEDKK